MSESDKFILLAEDDPVVAELILHALERTGAPRVVHVLDGVQALDFLHGRDAYEHREPGTPTLTILDVKMPRLDGLEVLRHIKTDNTLRTMPVVMLTSSQDERDVRTSYEFGANAYVVKPLEFGRLVEVLRALHVFWLEVNLPPPRPEMVSRSMSP